MGQIKNMQMFGPPVLNAFWCNALFGAKAVSKGGVVRRSVRDVELEIGRDAFFAEVRRRGFHLVECGNQFIIICHDGHMKVHC